MSNKSIIKSLVSFLSTFQFLTVFLFLQLNLFAEPYHGKTVTYHQPDKTIFEVKLYGDEYYAVAETIDGYVVTRDATSGFLCYARLAADGNSFDSTGVRAGQAVPVGMKKGLRIARQAMIDQSSAARTRFGVDSRGLLLPAQRQLLRPQVFQQVSSSSDGPQPGPPSSTTTGTRVGLVLLAQFPDLPDDVVVNRSQVDAYCNDPNYTSFSNATSIYGYFNIQSDGGLQYNCIVSAYFTTANNRAYYTDNAIAFGTRAKELINEGLQVLKTDGFDFTKCDADNNSVLDGVNIFYAGARVNSWNEGLWPHKWSSSWAGLSGEGVSTSFQYQISNMGSELSLGTFCHENGHMICGFPDLYSYNSNAAEVNNFSLMSSNGSKHPVSVDAYLKIHAGWANVVDVTSASHIRGTVEVDKNTFYRFSNPSESREYFILSMRTNTGYEGVYGGAASAVNPTNGLVIWHAREHGSNTYSTIFSADSPAADYTTPYELMVVEANPSSSTTPWYDDPYPGSNDGYHSGDVSEASDSTSPALKFWNTATGRTTTSNMHIHTISAQGGTMTFTIGTGAITGSPTIGLTSTALAPESEFDSDAPAQTFAVFNSNAGTLNYTITDNVSWLSVSPVSGSATTEADLITITYDTDALTNGIYNGTISIADGGATNSPQTIAVTLTVNAQPTIGLSTTTVSKSLNSGETGTGEFTISNTGGGTLSYSLSESVSWLSLSTSTGTVAAEEDEIDLTFDATGLFDNTYTADVTITSTNATNSPQTVTVSLIVSGSLMVGSPNGGETIWQGNKQDITWATGGGVTGDVKIDLYKGGALDSAIVASTPNDSLYVWGIPAGQTVGSDYRIRISSVDDASIYAESILDFSITVLPTLVSIPYSESFEADLGYWNQDATDDMDWTRDSGGTPSSATGPSIAQDGTFYVYTESSSPNYPSKSARLHCYFDLRTATAPLMSFYYHMYGSAMGSLVIRVSTDQKNWTNLLSQSGNQGNSWNQVNADLSAFAGRVITMQIFGTTGSSFTSDMALDALAIAEASKTLTYSTDIFSEGSADDGSISNSITITLAGDTFTSTAVSGGHVTAANVPAGLTAQFVRDSSTQITMSLSGNATDHDNENNITNLQVTCANAAFTGGDASSVTGNIKYLIIDYMQLLGLTIANSSVTEGDSGPKTLQLTVTLTPASGTITTVDYATSDGSATAGDDYTATNGTLTFAAGETSKMIDVIVAGDLYDELDETIAVTLSNASGSQIITDSIGVGTIIDDDTARIDVSTISGNTTEMGGSATFTIVLNSRPTDNVSISLTSSNTNEGTVSPTSLVFTTNDWDSPQTVTVIGVDDVAQDGNISYSIVIAAAVSTDGDYSGMNATDVIVTNVDDDTPGITTNAISGNTTEDGTTASFTLVLNTQPTDDVIIDLSSDDTTEGTIAISSLTFSASNWQIPQTVIVTGVNDDVDDGDITYHIVTAPATSSDVNYNGLNGSDITVINDDDDTVGITVSTLSNNTTELGTSATFTVVLISEPTANVVIGLTSDDTTEGTLSAATLTFTDSDWDMAQTVTVTGVDDILSDGNITYAIVTSAATSSDSVYNGMNPDDVSVVNEDNELAPNVNIEITPPTITVNENGNATMQVLLSADPGTTVTVSISRRSGDSDISASPSTMIFTSANWEIQQVLTLDATEDADRSHGTATFALDSVVGTTTFVATERDNDIPVDDDDDDEWYEPKSKCGMQPEGSSGLPFYLLIGCLFIICIICRRLNTVGSQKVLVHK